MGMAVYNRCILGYELLLCGQYKVCVRAFALGYAFAFAFQVFLLDAWWLWFQSVVVSCMQDFA